MRGGRNTNIEIKDRVRDWLRDTLHCKVGVRVYPEMWRSIVH